MQGEALQQLPISYGGVLRAGKHTPLPDLVPPRIVVQDPLPLSRVASQRPGQLIQEGAVGRQVGRTA